MTTAGRAGLGVGRRLRGWSPVIAVFVVIVLVWEFVLAVLGVQQFLLPRPSAIAAAFADQWSTLVEGTLIAATEALGGLVIGVGLGVLAAFVIGRWATARDVILPIALGASAIPIIAFAPIADNWFSSLNPAARWSIVALMTFLPTFVNVTRGLTNVTPAALELFRATAASEAQVLRKLRIPNAMPFFFTALKIATTLSVIGAVVGEYFGGPITALGLFILNSASLGRYTIAWAGIVMACLLGLGFYAAALLLERLVMPWYAKYQAYGGA